MTLQPLKKKRLSSQIVELIKEQIRTGCFKKGSRLPSERALAEMLDVGRSSVREAVILLESIGLLEVKPGEGIFVKDYDAKSSTGLLFDNMATIWEMDSSQILNLLQVREILEPQVATIAAERVTAEDLAELHNNLDLMKAAAIRGEVGDQADFQFHYVIARSTGNQVLIYILHLISDLMIKGLQQTRSIALYDKARIHSIIDEHESILQALEENDKVGAKVYMLRHLQGVITNYLEYLKEE